MKDANEREQGGAGPVTPSADDANGEEIAAAGQGQDLESELARAQAEAAEYLDNWRRAVAELSNARKRMQREAEEMRATAAARVLDRILPVADDIDRAFEAIPADLSAAGQEWLNGFRAIQRKMQAVLDAEGVIVIPTAGEMFDPNLHFAVTHEDMPDFSEGQIIAEVAKGYRLGDRVLRPSMVRVAKG